MQSRHLVSNTNYARDGTVWARYLQSHGNPFGELTKFSETLRIQRLKYAQNYHFVAFCSGWIPTGAPFY